MCGIQQYFLFCLWCASYFILICLNAQFFSESLKYSIGHESQAAVWKVLLQGPSVCPTGELLLWVLQGRFKETSWCPSEPGSPWRCNLEASCSKAWPRLDLCRGGPSQMSGENTHVSFSLSCYYHTHNTSGMCGFFPHTKEILSVISWVSYNSIQSWH